MEITYTMIGGDGQQYGPVTLEVFKTWIAEGRILADTKVMRSDTRSWLDAAQYGELGLAQQPAQPVPVATAPRSISAPQPFAASPQPVGAPQVVALLARRVQIAARWFFIVAVLSVINIFAAQAGTMFVVGLAAPFMVPAFVPVPGTAVAVVAAGLFAAFGFFARQGLNWAFIAGMVLYAGDAALCAIAQDWIMLAFHAYVLYRLFVGLRLSLELKTVQSAARV